MGNSFFGNYYVKPSPSAIRDAMDLFPKYGDYQEARRHALKLAYWPGEVVAGVNQVVDLDWEWIRALRAEQMGELRIQSTIGGHRNLRIAFWVPGKKLASDPLERIWTVAVVDKKSNDWTPRELRAFRARVTVLKQRSGY